MYICPIQSSISAFKINGDIREEYFVKIEILRRLLIPFLVVLSSKVVSSKRKAAT